MHLLFKLSLFLLTMVGSFLFSETLCTYEYFNQGHALQEHYMRNGYNAPACIELDAGFNLFLKGTCLYWKAAEQGLDLGFLRKDNKIKIHNLNFDYHLGAKGTAGGHLPGDSWNFYFTYLFYRNQKSSGKIHDLDFTNFWYLTPELIEIAPPSSISSKWKLKMDIMDAYFSRPFYLGMNLTLEPFIGARGGWINQKYKVPGSSISALILHESNEFVNKTNSRSWMVGALSGVNSNWIIVDFFRIYANFCCALMYQNFKVGNEQKIILQQIPISDYSTHYKIKNVTPSFDALMGLAWGSYLFKKRIHLDFSVGYDFVIFWNQNAIAYVVGGLLKQIPGSAMNSLMLHGLSGAIRVDF